VKHEFDIKSLRSTAQILICSRCMVCFCSLVEVTIIDFFLVTSFLFQVFTMPETFDVDHVLANISEQDKIALLSGNVETVIFEVVIR
jgi:hypothetical protein